MELRASIQLALQRSSRHMNLARAQLGSKQQSRPAVAAKPPGALRRGLVPAHLLVARNDFKTFFGQTDPRNKCGAMSTLAPPAMTMGKKQGRRSRLKANVAAQAAALIGSPCPRHVVRWCHDSDWSANACPKASHILRVWVGPLVPKHGHATPSAIEMLAVMALPYSCAVCSKIPVMHPSPPLKSGLQIESMQQRTRDSSEGVIGSSGRLSDSHTLRTRSGGAAWPVNT